MDSLISSSIQCWTCSIFDRLFQIVSNSATYIYDHFATLCLVLLIMLFMLYTVNAIMQNMKTDVTNALSENTSGDLADPFFKKSIQKVFLNSIVVIAILGAGAKLPRLITTIIFEPVASITMVYTQSMVQADIDQIDAAVPYTPEKMSDDGFFRPQLRDKMLILMRTTVAQFQGYIKLGIAITDAAFSWHALAGISNLLKHIMLFFLGLFLAWEFIKLFFKYSFRFVDAIVAMAFFSFFLPLSFVTMAFKDAEHVPDWFKKLGNGVGLNQIKNLINSIVSLGSIVITYTIIIAVLGQFFSQTGADFDALMQSVTSGSLYDYNVDLNNLESMTLMGCCILVYVLNYIYGQSKVITKMILDAFGVEEKTEYGDKVADTVMKFGEVAITQTANIAKAILNKDNKDNNEDQTENKDKK